MMNQNIYEHAKFFVEECGQRVAGTDSLLKASDYIAKYYQENGIQTETHDFEVPVCKVENSLLKARINGEWTELAHTAALFSKETPEGGITLPLVYVENGSVANFKEQDVKGKAVLICRDVYMVYPDISMYKRLHEYGAAAVIYTTNDGHWDVPYVYANFETMDAEYTIPTAIIHYKTALELLNKGASEIHMEAQFDITMGKTRNTIGVVEGTKKKEETIIVCAHLDSAVSSTGATDDVAAVAMIMELAKYYSDRAKAGNPPERTIRFIAWSGHECGLHGSKYYLLDHRDIFDSTKFVLNYDIVGNTLCNYVVWGAGEASIEAKLNEITAQLEYNWPVNMVPMVVDTLNFAVKEIPQITLMAGFCGGNHTKYDALDLISPVGFTSPIRFSEAVIDWAAGEGEIQQGYPQWLVEGSKEACEMYGWGLFGKI